MNLQTSLGWNSSGWRAKHAYKRTEGWDSILWLAFCTPCLCAGGLCRGSPYPMHLGATEEPQSQSQWLSSPPLCSNPAADTSLFVQLPNGFRSMFRSDAEHTDRTSVAVSNTVTETLQDCPLCCPLVPLECEIERERERVLNKSKLYTTLQGSAQFMPFCLPMPQSLCPLYALQTSSSVIPDAFPLRDAALAASLLGPWLRWLQSSPVLHQSLPQGGKPHHPGCRHCP